jgi:hypothetical protein
MFAINTETAYVAARNTHVSHREAKPISMLIRKKKASAAPRTRVERSVHEFSISINKKSQLVERLRNDQPVGLIEEMKKRPCGLIIAIQETRKAIRFLLSAKARIANTSTHAMIPPKILIDNKLLI